MMGITKSIAFQNMAACEFMLCYKWPVRKSTATKNKYLFRDSNTFIDARSFLHSSQHGMNL